MKTTLRLAYALMLAAPNVLAFGDKDFLETSASLVIKPYFTRAAAFERGLHQVQAPSGAACWTWTSDERSADHRLAKELGMPRRVCLESVEAPSNQKSPSIVVTATVDGRPISHLVWVKVGWENAPVILPLYSRGESRDLSCGGWVQASVRLSFLMPDRDASTRLSGLEVSGWVTEQRDTCHPGGEYPETRLDYSRE